MSTSKHIEKICIAVVCIVLALTVLFMCGGSLGIEAVTRAFRYENTIFDTSYVHSIDIVMNDWDDFIENCESEEYSSCTVAIDGEKHSNIAIRAKGNTSLSNVSSLGSQRYSFKMEFDHYEDSKTLDGLDKLCLNNLIQDNTMMKDYIVYRLMAMFGADTPLCSFAYLTVNGEDWGLYLAVEGVEDSFLERNYGSDIGNLYKPDSMSFGGGRGNGKDFNMDDFNSENSDETDTTQTDTTKQTTETKETQKSTDTAETNKQNETPQGGGQNSQGGGQMPQGEQNSQGTGQNSQNAGQMAQGRDNSQAQSGGNQMPGNFSPDDLPDDFDPSSMGGNFAGGGMTPPDMSGNQSDITASATTETDSQASDSTDSSDSTAQDGRSKDGGFGGGGMDKGGQGDQGGQGGGMGGGMGSDDVKLKYIDDDPDSYSNIFDNAKTDIKDSDKERLINSLKNLSSYTDLENTVDIDEVIRYFVVHNFVCNGDSYTGSMIHNYYLHESDGILSMIPWDYNLAFGTFQGNDASGTVNTSIDSPVSGGSVDDRPMLGWIFSSEEYTEMYHEYFAEFISEYFDNGYVCALIAETAELIRPYVEKDPTKFCTTEEFEAGVVALGEFCNLRAEAVARQLDGDTTTVNTGDLNLSDMGTMATGQGGGGGNMPNMGNFNFDASSMITLKDANGNEVDLSTVIPDITAIASATLSDGSTIDMSGDTKALMNTDFSDIVSVTDKDGKVIDLSGYTISVNMPDMSSIMGSGMSMPNQTAGNSDGSTPPEKPDGDSSENSGTQGTPPEMPQGAQNGEDGSSTAPEMPQGENNTENNSADSSDTQSSTDTKNSADSKGGFDKGSFDSSNFDPGSMPDGTTTASSNTSVILVVVSGAVLVLGLIIAFFKKY